MTDFSKMRHLYLPGERRGLFNPQGAKNADEVIITESVIDAAALWSVGIRSVIPAYGVTGLTDEIVNHLVDCRVKRVALMLDTDEAGRAAALEMSARLEQSNITSRIVELPAKDAAEYLTQGGTAYDLCSLLAPPKNEESDKPPVLEQQSDGSYLMNLDQREYRIRGLSAVGMDRLKVNVRLTVNGNFHLDTLDLYQSRSRASFAHTAARSFAM
jgi:5S rRNA maturation endonuclease (ribonuclease M5)